MTAIFTEDTVEQAALECLSQVGYTPLFAPNIAPGEMAAERESCHSPLLPPLISGELRV